MKHRANNSMGRPVTLPLRTWEPVLPLAACITEEPAMKCFASDEREEFLLCITDVEPDLIASVEAAYFTRDGDRFVKRFPASLPNKDIVARNFATLAEPMIHGRNADWQAALWQFATTCARADIEWYATGSVCDALRGIAITPHDLDLVVHVRDFFRTGNAFPDAIVEPFIDTGGAWVVRYFGRLCLVQTQVDVVADAARNADVHVYDVVRWRGLSIRIEPFEVRLQAEEQRQRHDRLAAFEAYLAQREA